MSIRVFEGVLASDFALLADFDLDGDSFSSKATDVIAANPSLAGLGSAFGMKGANMSIFSETGLTSTTADALTLSVRLSRPRRSSTFGALGFATAFAFGVGFLGADFDLVALGDC